MSTEKDGINDDGLTNSSSPDPLHDELFYMDLINSAAKEMMEEIPAPLSDALSPALAFAEEEDLDKHINWDPDKPERCLQKIETDTVDHMLGHLLEVIPETLNKAIYDEAEVLKDIAHPSESLSGNALNEFTRIDTTMNLGDLGQSFYFLPVPVRKAEAAKPGSVTGIFDVDSVRQDFPILQQKVNNKPLIWLDNAATTQKPLCVIKKLAQYYELDNSNVHRGAHTIAMRATDAYEDARKKIQQFIDAGSPDEIVFLRGTTEAINLIAQAWGRQHIAEGDEIILSELEHHANIVPWQFLCQEKGAVLRVIPISDSGEVMIGEFAKLLGPRTRLVAISQVSNVLGTVVPVSQIVKMSHSHGVPVLVDGAQAVPHLTVNVRELDCDFYAFSGHKLFGPTGIGVLYGKKHLLDEMPPWQGGGNMIDRVTFKKTTFNRVPAKFEAGTGNIADAVGLGAAVDYICKIGRENAAAYEQGLMSYGTAALAAVPGLRQFGPTEGKVCTLSFIIPGIQPEDLAAFLDKEGIAVRAGHHCAQPTMARYGLTSMVRPSIAFYNTKAEIDALVEAILKAKKGLE